MTTPVSPEHDPKIEQLHSILKRLLDEKILADREFQKIDHEFQERTQREVSSLRAKNLRLTVLSVLSSVLLSLAALVAKGYAENEDRDTQALRDEQQRAADILRDAKHKKDEIIAAISGAISNIREGKEIAELYCQQKLPPEKQIALKVERITNRYKLILRARTILHYFSDDFRVLIREFLSWEEKIKDYCSITAPVETEWRDKQLQIETEMAKAPVSLFE